MISSESSPVSRRPYDSGMPLTRMPEPEIPTRKMPWFMKALWALALLLVIGLVYSFWRIAAVPSPRLDVPQPQGTDAPVRH